MRHRCAICGFEYSNMKSLLKMHEIIHVYHLSESQLTPLYAKEHICHICHDCLKEYGMTIADEPCDDAESIVIFRDQLDDIHEINHISSFDFPIEFFAVAFVNCVTVNSKMFGIILNIVLVIIGLLLTIHKIRQIQANKKNLKN